MNVPTKKFIYSSSSKLKENLAQSAELLEEIKRAAETAKKAKNTILPISQTPQG